MRSIYPFIDIIQVRVSKAGNVQYQRNLLPKTKRRGYSFFKEGSRGEYFILNRNYSFKIGRPGGLIKNFFLIYLPKGGINHWRNFSKRIGKNGGIIKISLRRPIWIERFFLNGFGDEGLWQRGGILGINFFSLGLTNLGLKIEQRRIVKIGGLLKRLIKDGCF